MEENKKRRSLKHLSKFTQNYPTERKNYPNTGSRASQKKEEERDQHGKVSAEEAMRIQSYDLPMGDHTAADDTGGPIEPKAA